MATFLGDVQYIPKSWDIYQPLLPLATQKKTPKKTSQRISISRSRPQTPNAEEPIHGQQLRNHSGSMAPAKGGESGCEIWVWTWKCWVNIPNEIAIFHRDN